MGVRFITTAAVLLVALATAAGAAGGDMQPTVGPPMQGRIPAQPGDVLTAYTVHIKATACGEVVAEADVSLLDDSYAEIIASSTSTLDQPQAGFTEGHKRSYWFLFGSADAIAGRYCDPVRGERPLYNADELAELERIQCIYMDAAQHACLGPLEFYLYCPEADTIELTATPMLRIEVGEGYKPLKVAGNEIDGVERLDEHEEYRLEIVDPVTLSLVLCHDACDLGTVPVKHVRKHEAPEPKVLVESTAVPGEIRLRDSR